MPELSAPTDSRETLEEEVLRLRAENAQLRALVEQLAEKVRELEARLAKNSRNSSKPPSSDPPFDKPPPRSQRKPSGKKPGGQQGHRGATRALADTPDRTVEVPLAGACECGRDLAAIPAQIQPERRQVAELTVRREIVEYRLCAGTCACGRTHRSAFPAGVEAPVQYGPGLRAFAVYLTHYQLLPVRRSAELLHALAGIPVAASSVCAMAREAAAQLAAPVAAIGEALARAPLAHADETGLRLGGALHWLHVLCTATLTFYFVHAKRGREALAACDPHTRFAGVLVHDHWAAYDAYDGPHAFCNAHHLRELVGMAERYPAQTWPERMIRLLCEAKEAADAARAAGLAALPPERLEDFRRRYGDILDHGERRHPRRSGPPGRRGRVKQSPAYNLIARLRDRRDETLRFLSDLRVPFDNNQAERDIRMPKLKQKVSGSFRSTAGADAFATVRSYLSTLRKQSFDVLDALVMTFQGRPPMPRLA